MAVTSFSLRCVHAHTHVLGLAFGSWNVVAGAIVQVLGEGAAEDGRDEVHGETRSHPVRVEAIASESGVDMEGVLEQARALAREGWRLRGAIRGRPQVEALALKYAGYPGVVVTPFSQLVFSRDASADRRQLEMVELRGTSRVLSGSLVRIIAVTPRRPNTVDCPALARVRHLQVEQSWCRMDGRES
jgi:hypothetical protein